MQAPREFRTGYSLQSRLRVFDGSELILGWGKILLLEHIRETGSIAVAAQQMEISYNHAWTLIRTMNQRFREPLVQTTRGGSKKGGANLTQTGEQVIALYVTMVRESEKSTRESWEKLQALLVKA